MTTPYVPPYFGSWEELVRSLINNPFLGGGTQTPHPLLAYMLQQQRPPHIGPPDPGPMDIANFLRTGITSELNPQPLPPRSITSLFVFQLAVRDLTSRLPKEQGAEMTARLDEAVSDEIDFVCGNVPHPHPPIPGPSPFAFTVAGELNLIGNTMQEGSLRTSVTQLASQIANRATAPVVVKKEPRVAA
jgi:hypothetical protein